MPMLNPSLRSVQNVLWLDAAGCAAMGLVLSVAPGAVAALTGLPSGLLLPVGLLLIPVALLMALAAWLRPTPRSLLLVLVAGNAAWVAASLLVLALGLVEPNGLGIAFVLAQAAWVAALTVLEAGALRTRPLAP